MNIVSEKTLAHLSGGCFIMTGNFLRCIKSILKIFKLI